MEDFSCKITNKYCSEGLKFCKFTQKRKKSKTCYEKTSKKKKRKKNFMGPLYGWGSTALRLKPLQGGSLLFTTSFQKFLVFILSTSEG